MNEVVRVAIYVRVSTDKIKDGQNYQRQIEDLSHIINNKYKNVIIDEYKEKKSGYNDDREELKRLLDKIAEDNKYYKGIYSTELSRIGRNPKKIREVLYFLEEVGVNLHVQKNNITLLNDDGKVDGIGRLVMDIMINLADEEARTTKQRSISGIKSSILSGKVGGGKFKPYGFKKDEETKMLVIDEDEAIIVRQIFNLYKSGYGTKVIAGILNEDKVKTRTNKSFGDELVNKKKEKKGKDVIWSDKTINDILLNPIYKGERRYWGGKENRKKGIEPTLFKMSGEPILKPTTLFDECLEIRKTKTHKNHLTKYTYLLKDKMICGVCGRNYFAKYKPLDDKVYICSSRLLPKGNCGNIGVNISLIESAIFQEIIDDESVVKYLNSSNVIRKNIEDKITSLIRDVARTKKEINKNELDINSTIKLNIDAQGKNNTFMVEKYESLLEGYQKDLINSKNRLINFEIELEKTLIAHQTETTIENTVTTLKNSIDDRIKLRSIFIQIVEKVIINKYDNNTAMVNLYLSLDGIPLPNSCYIFLDISGIRKRVKQYRYMPVRIGGFDIKYENNILKSNNDEIKYLLQLLDEQAGLIDTEYKYILPKYQLTIPLSL